MESSINKNNRGSVKYYTYFPKHTPSVKPPFKMVLSKYVYKLHWGVYIRIDELRMTMSFHSKYSDVKLQYHKDYKDIAINGNDLKRIRTSENFEEYKWKIHEEVN